MVLLEYMAVDEDLRGSGIGTALHIAPTLMTTLAEREALARSVLSFADSLK